MRIFYELRGTVIIETVTFYLKSISAKFQKYSKHIFLELSAGHVRQNCRATLVIPPGTSVATTVTICCNHRDDEYFLHRITRKLGPTPTSTMITRLFLWQTIYPAQKMRYCELCEGTPTEILKCAHHRPRSCWRWLQLQPSCGSAQWGGAFVHPLPRLSALSIRV